MLPWSPFATWKSWKFSLVIEFHSQIGSSVFQHSLQLVSDTDFAITVCLKLPQILLSYYAIGKTKTKNNTFFLCYWRKKKNAWSWWTHTTKTSLQSWQGCQPAEHCKKRSLKKLITASRSNYTWKSTTKSSTVWQNWTQNRVVEGAKSMHHSTVLCNSGLPPQNMRIHARGPQIHPSDFHCAQNLL